MGDILVGAHDDGNGCFIRNTLLKEIGEGIEATRIGRAMKKCGIQGLRFNPIRLEAGEDRSCDHGRGTTSSQLLPPTFQTARVDGPLKNQLVKCLQKAVTGAASEPGK